MTAEKWRRQVDGLRRRMSEVRKGWDGIEQTTGASSSETMEALDRWRDRFAVLKELAELIEKEGGDALVDCWRRAVAIEKHWGRKKSKRATLARASIRLIEQRWPRWRRVTPCRNWPQPRC